MLKIPEIINFQLSEKNRADLKLLLPKMSVFKKKCIYDMIFDIGIKALMDKYPDISGGDDGK